MNLMEITKGYEPKQSEQQEQTKNSLGTTDRWKQLVKEQAETLEKVTEERDELQVRNQKMNEFILEFQKRTHSLKNGKTEGYSSRITKCKEEMQKYECRNSADDRRIVRNAETQSVFTAEQRRLEEQKRLDEKERARAARKKK